MSLILLQIAPLMTEVLTPAPTTTEAEADPRIDADITMEPDDEDGTNGGVAMTLSPLVVATVTLLVAMHCLLLKSINFHFIDNC